LAVPLPGDEPWNAGRDLENSAVTASRPQIDSLVKNPLLVRDTTAFISAKAFSTTSGNPLSRFASTSQHRAVLKVRTQMRAALPPASWSSLLLDRPPSRR